MTLMRNEGTNHLAGMNISDVGFFWFFFFKTGSQKKTTQTEFKGVIESESHGHTDIN